MARGRTLDALTGLRMIRMLVLVAIIPLALIFLAAVVWDARQRRRFGRTPR
jgi:hypothetical protein